MTEHNRDGDSWWEERKIGQKVLMGIGFGILGVGFLFLVGLVTMLLWNVLMPQIFGLTTITYWQTWGLLILSFIFFKNWGNGEKSGRKERKRKRHLRQYMSQNGNGGTAGGVCSDIPGPAGKTGGGPEEDSADPLTEA